jgi:hypothetical protein
MCAHLRLKLRLRQFAVDAHCWAFYCVSEQQDLAATAGNLEIRMNQQSLHAARGGLQDRTVDPLAVSSFRSGELDKVGMTER